MGTLRDILATRHGIGITEQQERLLFDDLHAIMEINKTMNLTRILSEEDGAVLHLEDSVLGLPYVNDAPVGLYGDLGTGGGFPAFPCACLRAAKPCSSIRLRRRFAPWSRSLKNSALAIASPRMAVVSKISPLNARRSFRCLRLVL